MAKIIGMAGQASGIGKTTTAVNLGVGLALAGCSTVVVDWAPAQSAARQLGVTSRSPHPWIVGSRLVEHLSRTACDGLQVLGGNFGIKEAETLDRWEARDCWEAAARLDGEFANFDLVIIDCPPSLSVLTETACCAASELILPIRCDYSGLDHVPDLVQLVRKVLATPGKKLDFTGVILTHYDARRELTVEMDRRVRDFFGEIVYGTVVPEDPSLAEAARGQRTIWEFDPYSRGTRAYQELCMEVLGR